MNAFDKSALRDELLSLLEAELQAAERAYRSTIEGATHEEAKPENEKDTRALEQTYLARGQALRAEELKSTVAEVKAMPVEPLAPDAAIRLGALVEATNENDEKMHVFIAAGGGGRRLSEKRLQVVTPKSPLGAAMIGKRAGEACEIMVAGRQREIVIDTVA